jgi:alpha-beta hydrolase superfamily lysophospholipase
MRRAAIVLLLLLAGLAALVWLGPRETVDPSAARAPEPVGDLDAWLAEAEQAEPGLRPEAAKRILWARPDRGRTPLAIVYLHGFSATSAEIAPVPQQVAKALGANLFLTRLAGHGLADGGLGLAAATPAAWLDDTAEALATGRAIGDRVILVGTSTGGSLALLAAFDPVLSRGLAGLVLVSPNLRLMARGTEILTLPHARLLAPLIAGRERSFAPHNAAHAEHWTTRYPTEALVPMAAVAAAADALPFETASLPALFVFADADQVVSAARTREVIARWGGPVTVRAIEPGPGDDPSAHVIAGDIMSPGLTQPVIDAILTWAGGI